MHKVITEARDRGLPTEQILSQVNAPNTIERKTTDKLMSPPLKSAGAAIMLK
jgi:hypothetical protein